MVEVDTEIELSSATSKFGEEKCSEWTTVVFESWNKKEMV
jgi:hypothetical protein